MAIRQEQATLGETIQSYPRACNGTRLCLYPTSQAICDRLQSDKGSVITLRSLLTALLACIFVIERAKSYPRDDPATIFQRHKGIIGAVSKLDVPPLWNQPGL